MTEAKRQLTEHIHNEQTMLDTQSESDLAKRVVTSYQIGQSNMECISIQKSDKLQPTEVPAHM